MISFHVLYDKSGCHCGQHSKERGTMQRFVPGVRGIRQDPSASYPSDPLLSQASSATQSQHLGFQTSAVH